MISDEARAERRRQIIKKLLTAWNNTALKLIAANDYGEAFAVLLFLGTFDWSTRSVLTIAAEEELNIALREFIAGNIEIAEVRPSWNRFIEAHRVRRFDAAGEVRIIDPTPEQFAAWKDLFGIEQYEPPRGKSTPVAAKQIKAAPDKREQIAEQRAARGEERLIKDYDERIEHAS